VANRWSDNGLPCPQPGIYQRRLFPFVLFIVALNQHVDIIPVAFSQVLTAIMTNDGPLRFFFADVITLRINALGAGEEEAGSGTSINL